MWVGSGKPHDVILTVYCPLTTEVPDIEEQSKKQEFTQVGEGKDPSLKDFR